MAYFWIANSLSTIVKPIIQIIREFLLNIDLINFS